MRLLDTKKRVPGGWRYEQFDASGRLLHKFQSFNPWMMFLGDVSNFRKLNKLARADIDSVEADVTEFLAREFGGDPKYFVTDAAQKKTSATSLYQRSKGALARLAARGSQLYAGGNVIKDWLGDGLKPVSQEVAQARSDICAGRLDGKPCPNNTDGFKPVETIASIIRAWSEKKNEMKLTTIGEEKLHTCMVCWCDLKLKVHVPAETILAGTPKAMLEKFASEAPEKCWMRQKP